MSDEPKDHYYEREMDNRYGPVSDANQFRIEMDDRYGPLNTPPAIWEFIDKLHAEIERLNAVNLEMLVENKRLQKELKEKV